MQHDANRHMFSAVHAESNRTKQHQISTVEHLLRLLELTLLELWRETVLLWKVASMLDRLGSMGSIVSTVSKYRLCSHTINMNQYISCTLQAFACPICPHCCSAPAASPTPVVRSSAVFRMSKSPTCHSPRTRWIHWPPELARPPKARWILGTSWHKIHRNPPKSMNLIQFDSIWFNLAIHIYPPLIFAGLLGISLDAPPAPSAASAASAASGPAPAPTPAVTAAGAKTGVASRRLFLVVFGR